MGRWRIAAPASAALIALSAICEGVMGRYSDMVGVWTEPVTAQLRIILGLLLAIFGLGTNRTIIRSARLDATGSERDILMSLSDTVVL